MKHQNGFSKFMIFQLFPSVRAYDNETAAKLVCCGQIEWRKDVSVVAVNFEAIFCPSGGRNVAISSFVQNSYCLTNLSLQLCKKNQIFLRWHLHLVHVLTLPPTIHILYFMSSKSSKSENTIVKSLNSKNLSSPYQGSIFTYVLVLGLVFVRNL